MSFEVIEEEDKICLRLDGRVGVPVVRSMYDALQKHAFDPRRLVVDAANCDRLDTSVVQLLYALKKKFQALTIVNRSSGFEESLARVGYIKELEQSAEGDSK